MSPTLLSIAAAFAVMIVSLSGVVFASKALGDWMYRHLTYLATFSAGVLTILAYHLLEEAFHEGNSAAVITASVIAGAVALELIHHLLPDGTHHHHEVPADHTHTAVDGRRVLVSDAVHNVTDGFIIVPAFFIDWKIGVGATIGIVLHELVQEIAEFFVLREAGYSTRQALTFNFISSSTILIGVALALVLVSFEGLLAILAALAAGGFLSVVLRDLLPHAVESVRKHGQPFLHIAAAALGVVIMLGLITIVPEGHDDEAELRTLATADR